MGKNKRVMSTWVTVGVVVVMCVLGSAAYMSSGSSSTTTQTKVTQVQAKKGTPASSAPVVPEKKDTAKEWQTVSPEDAKKEKDAKALDKKKEWSSAAHTEKEHGPYYEAKHSAAGQVHGAYYADKHKSAKQLTEEKGERQEQWIKDKALQNKRDSEAKYERTKKAEKEKKNYLASKNSKGPASSSSTSASSEKAVTAPTNPVELPSGGAGGAEAHKDDNVIGPDGQVYCNEIGLGVCLNRVAGVCLKNGPCIPAPTAEPTHFPSEGPTHAPTQVVTTLANCDPWSPPCLNRTSWGLCYNYANCIPGQPSQEPTLAPTAMPSTTDDCDPYAPPCKHDFISVCYEYYPCHRDGNHDHYNEPWYAPWTNWFSNETDVSNDDMMNSTHTDDEKFDDEGHDDEGEEEEPVDTPKPTEAPKEEPKEAPKEEPKEAPKKEDDDSENNDVAMPAPEEPKEEPKEKKDEDKDHEDEDEEEDHEDHEDHEEKEPCEDEEDDDNEDNDVAMPVPTAQSVRRP